LLPVPRHPKTALVVFARHPRGRVKTRLAPALTPAAARQLHVACLESTLRVADSLPRRVARFLYLTASRRRHDLNLPRRFRLRTQRGRDLGARLRAALRALIAAGYRRVVFIGSDSPTLPAPRLRRALSALGRAEAVLGPARDGGYYLIGLRAKRNPSTAVFRGIDWGTPRAFRQQRARLRRLQLPTVVLPAWYDVDVPADLTRLQRDVAATRAAHLAPLRAWFRSAD
jgi:hypothetical protein